MRRMHRRALMLAISFGLLSLGGLPHEGAAAPRFLPAEPPQLIGDPDTPPEGPSAARYLAWIPVPLFQLGETLFVHIPYSFKCPPRAGIASLERSKK